MNRKLASLLLPVSTLLLLLAGPIRADNVHYTLSSSSMMGSHTFTDGTTIDLWGFRLGGGMGAPEVPGPVITANEGDHVFLHFTNMSPMPHTIHPHGLDVDQQMLALSTYVGHAMVTNTYWYLTGIPELMAVAAERFESFTQMPEVYHD